MPSKTHATDSPCERDAFWEGREAERKEMRDKLQRIRDWMKHEANSPGGIVAEIDAILEAPDGTQPDGSE